jgi:hypothetical protein
MYNFKILCQVQSIVDVLIADLIYIVIVNLIGISYGDSSPELSECCI